MAKRYRTYTPCHFCKSNIYMIGVSRRFLAVCWKDPSYHSKLSEASKTTLSYQGGPLTTQEANTFEADVDFETILKLRLCDEAAKISDAEVPDLQYYTGVRYTQNGNFTTGPYY